ncbi:hypothetical protein BDB00DRAFT_851794 [Zychaea mexicana]|uniref:uncharacterized protein n=1 Tax=Zychaea mexicana TaxID=64656 RepID=UPI0022FE357D|nr:uncharacterized protein BDB00DRAFT_851794 [Zychaea mexicana]KAI9485007.1 hypothetical protein BDB00DRAFT_851794 [Zychaea mexicana]
MKAPVKLSGLVLSILSAGTTVMARSAVYMASSNDQPLGPIDKPTISLDAYSVVMSQLTDTADTHPVMQWKDAYQQQTFESVRGVWNNRDAWLCHEQDDVFEPKLDSILYVIVSGVEQPEAILPDPAFYVSENHAHAFKDVAKDNVESVSASGRSATALKHASSSSSEEELIEQFKEAFGDVFDLDEKADKSFATEVMHLKSIVADAKSNAFSTIRVRGLKTLAKEYGVKSTQYTEGERILNELFQKTVIPEFLEGEKRRALVSVVLTPAKHAVFRKRALPETDVCYKTEDDCINGTSGCTGRGSCVADSNDCYSCQCKAASFQGEACEVENVVADFQLLFWTGVALIILTTGSLMFVYQSGGGSDSEGVMMVPQSLPKQD